MKVNWQPTIDPLGNETHQFIAESGNHRNVSGCLWIPKTELKQCVLVAFLHGASGNRVQVPIPYLANSLASRGIASLAIDGPVHGLRKKLDGGRIALYAEMSKPKAFNNLFKDWELAISLSESKLQFEVQTLAYFGLSMGTFFGIPYLANRHLNGNTTAAAVLGLLGPTGVVAPFRKRLLQDANSVEFPLLFLLQQDDEMFNRDGCLELYNALSSPSKQLRENPGKHSDVPTAELDHSIDFLAKHIHTTVCSNTHHR